MNEKRVEIRETLFAFKQQSVKLIAFSPQKLQNKN